MTVGSGPMVIRQGETAPRNGACHHLATYVAQRSSAVFLFSTAGGGCATWRTGG